MSEDDAKAWHAYRQAGVRYRLARRVCTELRPFDQADGAEMRAALDYAREQLVEAFAAMVGRGLINGGFQGLQELLRGAE